MRGDGVAVVTGGGSGIGRAIVATLLEAGWACVAVERDTDAAARLQQLQEPSLVTVVGDVCDSGVLEEAVQAARRLGELTAWVNNAAMTSGRPLRALTEAHVDAVLATNVAAYARGAALAVEEMRARGTRGAVVNIGSVHGRLAFPGFVMYDVSKGAVEALTRAVAAEAGPHGIRCNAVAPGSVMVEREVATRAAGPLPEEPIPPAMFVAPEAIADVVAFLCSTASRAVNGAVLAADGGLSSVFPDETWRRAPAPPDVLPIRAES